MGVPGQALRIEVRVGTGEALGGAPLAVPGGAEAALVLDRSGVLVRLALPEAPVAELRWIVDQALRKVKKALVLEGSVTLDLVPGTPHALGVALALDLRRAFGARVVHALGAEVDAVAEALYRAWVDEDATTRTSVAIAQDIAAWGEAQRGVRPVEVTVHGPEACARLGLRLLAAVGGASQISPPTLVLAHYTPPGAEGRPRMLLGKGITFDSGGINVKPYESFVSMMKNDMAGAALAWALFKHLVEAGHPEPLLLVIPTCENPIGEGAMRPGTVVESYAGLKVRIDHTDAEGRLILADALAYACDTYDPRDVWCFATLTTAALIAYGPHATPVHFADAATVAALSAASEATGEDLHFFPRRVWHYEANRDEIADVRNTGALPGHASRGAGSRNAGHFLLHFTQHPLVHVDIFATTWNWSGDVPGSGPGATGAPLRTLLAALSAR